MPWYVFFAQRHLQQKSPTKSDITPQAGKGEFKIDGGTDLELWTNHGWDPVQADVNGKFEPTAAQINALAGSDTFYVFRINKATAPTLSNVQAKNFTTGQFENSFFMAS